jgi:hypothetical protein
MRRRLLETTWLIAGGLLFWFGDDHVATAGAVIIAMSTLFMVQNGGRERTR